MLLMNTGLQRVRVGIVPQWILEGRQHHHALQCKAFLLRHF